MGHYIDQSHRCPADRTESTWGRSDKSDMSDSDGRESCIRDTWAPHEEEPGERTRRDILGDHLRRLADLVTAVPGPDRPEALTDAEVDYLAAAVRTLDVETSAMIVGRLRGLRAHVPSAREGEDGGARPTPRPGSPPKPHPMVSPLHTSPPHTSPRSMHASPPSERNLVIT